MLPGSSMFESEGLVGSQLEKILGSRMVNCGNKATSQLLIHWKNCIVEDATWEFFAEFVSKFPHFNLADKVA